MEFVNLRKDIRSLNLDSLRIDGDNFFEAVLIKDELQRLNRRLKSFLGEPLYPSKSRLPLKVRRQINAFGGIMPGQTLYYKAEADAVFFAMLWPWNDGLRTTLKIVRK